MSIFGEKCCRCGKRTRAEQEGVAICTHCQAEIKMSKENCRVCPGDDVLMRKEIILGIVIDKCPECGGIWLDAGELDLIKKAISNQQFSSGFLLGMVAG